MARSLGFVSRKKMYAAMTAGELAEWETDFAISPWGEERADLRNGILCSLTDACHRTKGRAEPPAAYMPFMKEKRIPQTQESMKAIWKLAVANWNK